jgi:hypothetical protein
VRLPWRKPVTPAGEPRIATDILASAAAAASGSDPTPLVAFVATSPIPAVTPLRLIVPAPEARETALGVLRERLPEHEELELPFPSDDAETERRIFDWWLGLPAEERSRVACVCGQMAGCLMRVRERPAAGFAFVGPPARSERANPQARALLAAAYPDSWTLALDGSEPVDADRWRYRLATVLSERWGAGDIVHPTAAFEAMFSELELEHPLPSPTLMFRIRPEAGRKPAEPKPNWLDYELYERVAAMFEEGAIEPLRTDPPTQWAWHRARSASLERRIRRLENLLMDREAHAPPGGPNGTPPSALLIDDPSEAAARNDPKTVVGREGWLFLGSDSHDSHSQVIGERRLSEEELQGWETGIARREALVRSHGSRLATVIGPAPQVIHADVLPEGVDVARDRPVQQVLARLSSLDPRPNIVYPVAELSSTRRLLSPFPKTDSHWNDVGAFLAYEAMMDSLRGEVPSRRLGRDDVSFHETMYAGDLGSKLRPERAGIFLRATIDDPQAELVEDNRVRNHGRRAIYQCGAAPPGTCVVFGDSWAYGMLLFLAESFSRVVFHHRVNVVDEKPIAEEKPDLVLVLLTERFMTAIPADGEAVDFQKVVNKKLKRGHLMPAETPPKSRVPFLHSVRLDRGLPTTPGLRLSGED